MNKPRQGHLGTPISQFLPPDQLEEILAYARDPHTVEDKLKLFDRLTVDYEVVNPHTGYKTRRSKIGTFINDLFKSKLALPIGQRRYQIGMAIKLGRDYLTENPDASIYFAAAMGAAEEYREWMASVGDLQPEQQMAIMNNESKK